MFFDHFGPITTRPDDNHDVRPHPHIGLSTVTYLFEGAMLHRDSLGSVQRIEPGAINWMTAGRGIVHSERAPDDLRGTTYDIHGLQLWAALPKAHEETDPAFFHTPAAALPAWSQPGIRARVLIGNAFGRQSPVKTFSTTLYVDVAAEPGHCACASDPSPESSAPSTASISRSSPTAATCLRSRWPFSLPVANRRSSRRRARATSSSAASRSMATARVWWNFVSSSKERIEQAKAAWREQRMGRIPGEHEWIPLP